MTWIPREDAAAGAHWASFDAEEPAGRGDTRHVRHIQLIPDGPWVQSQPVTGPFSPRAPGVPDWSQQPAVRSAGTASGALWMTPGEVLNLLPARVRISTQNAPALAGTLPAKLLKLAGTASGH
jgi:hypothetical protein